MENIEKIKKEIEQMVSKIAISEIRRRIEQDELEEENIELISNDELNYENIEIDSIEIKEEVKVWKNESLPLAA